MDTTFSYSTTYVLDKLHFSECYSESVQAAFSILAYKKAAILILFGWFILDFTDLSAYAGWFIVILGIIEALSIRYQKSWWLARQMLSKAANGKVTLTLDEKAISTKSVYVNSVILWADIADIEKTSLGWLVTHSNGKNYISAQCLSVEALEFMTKQRDILLGKPA